MKWLGRREGICPKHAVSCVLGWDAFLSTAEPWQRIPKFLLLLRINSACVLLCVYLCMYTCIHLEARGSCPVSYSVTLYCIFETSREHTDLAAWAPRKTQGSSCLHLPSTGMMDMCFQTWLSCGSGELSHGSQACKTKTYRLYPSRQI